MMLAMICRLRTICRWRPSSFGAATCTLVSLAPPFSTAARTRSCNSEPARLVAEFLRKKRDGFSPLTAVSTFWISARLRGDGAQPVEAEAQRLERRVVVLVQPVDRIGDRRSHEREARSAAAGRP